MKLMYTIAKNLCVDEYRRELTFPLDDERDTTHFSQDDVLNKIAISKALEKLSPEERELIFLRYANEESMITISSLYKCSRFSTHRKIKKAFEKLRNYLEVDIGDE